MASSSRERPVCDWKGAKAAKEPGVSLNLDFQELFRVDEKKNPKEKP